MLYIFSDSKVKFRISTSIEVKRLEIKLLAQHKPEYSDLTYVDISTLTKSAQTRVIKKLQALSKKSYCGIIDPENSLVDPANIFFMGLHDYIGQDLLKESISAKRIKAIKEFADSSKLCTISKPKEKTNLSDISFPGWAKVRKGQVYPFCFVYIKLDSETDMKARLGQQAYKACLQRFNKVLEEYFSDASGKLWVETEYGTVVLVPPTAKYMQKAVKTALRMQASAPIISYEKLKLPFLTNFIFAMHVGTSEYAPKGSTGKIVSESLNFIYHLGTNKSNRGRITVSEDAYDIFKCSELNEFFLPHGCFEEHKLLHSKRFSLPKAKAKTKQRKPKRK